MECGSITNYSSSLPACARDRLFYQQQQVVMEIDCKAPDGGEAGIYSLLQKRGLYSFCADEDGVRAGPLVREADKKLHKHWLPLIYQ